MNHDMTDYGLWFLVFLNSAIFIMFAFSFFKPQTARDWRTFGSFAAATAMFGGLRRRWGIAAFMLASAIGFSRIYLFMHYPTDVAAGAILGLISGYAAWQAAGKVLSCSEQRQSAAVYVCENGKIENR